MVRQRCELGGGTRRPAALEDLLRAEEVGGLGLLRELLKDVADEVVGDGWGPTGRGDRQRELQSPEPEGSSDLRGHFF